MSNIFSIFSNKKDISENCDDKKIENDYKIDHRLQFNLSLSPEQEGIISDVQREYMIDELKELEPIESGQVNISSTYIYDNGQEVEANIYLRNASERPLRFEILPLILKNSNGDEIANMDFDFRELGEVPPLSARPWKIYFNKSDLCILDTAKNDWKVCFGKLKTTANLIATKIEGLPEDIDLRVKADIEQYISTLPAIRIGEFSITKFKLEALENGDIIGLFILRNGNSKPVQIEELPIVIKNSEDIIITSGVFKPENLIVNPSKALIWSFVFNKSTILTDINDLNEAKVEFAFISQQK